MKKFLLAGAAIVACASAVAAGTAADAAPPTRRITVFSTEVTELTTWDDPTGCQTLPVGAHVLINQSDKTVNTYGDPLCLTPSLAVAPGYGTHVAPSAGSFAVEE